MNNTRQNRFITANGETLSISEWERRTGINRIDFRLNAGWCANCVVDAGAKTCTHGYNRTAKMKGAARRDNHFLTSNGKTLTVTEWSKLSGLKNNTITIRLSRYGFCENCAVSLSLGQTCPHKNFL